MKNYLTDILKKINNTEAVFPDDKCIHTFFEEQVSKTPANVAIKSGSEEITFEELNQRANQLAHYLMEKGLKIGDIAAVCMERSTDAVISMMGVLKAGAAYLPIDPAYPAERIQYLLKDSKSNVLITQERFTKLFNNESQKTIYIDKERNAIDKQHKNNPGISLKSESLAYIIYTSGSTGNPKGVMGSHRASINRFYWMWEKYRFGADDVCCQKTSLSFVDSIWEIFGPLLKGIKLIVINDYDLKDTEKLIKMLFEEKVSRIVLVPSLLRAMLNSINQTGINLPDLRYWFCSGEALTYELYKEFKSTLSESKLINIYGSSEVAADVTVFDTDEIGNLKFVPIGKPISNCEVYILNESLEMVSVDEDGELYVTGECLSKGYLHKPELTKERFVPNPFSKYPLMYKTGDMVRCHRDGSIEYIGRADNQIKLRGYRIELGEIENAINKLDGVRESIVLLIEDQYKSAYLKAFIISKQGNKTDSREMRNSLRHSLPEHMIPAEFQIIEEFPLTPNGKIDRNKLRALKNEIPQESRVVVDPANVTEEEVTEIWKEVLGMDEIGVTENFFEIGGHSLIATKIISRIRYSFDIDLPLKIIFKSPTIRELSDEIVRIITEEVIQMDEEDALKLLSLQE